MIEVKPARATVAITNVPRTATAAELAAYFDSSVGPTYAVAISSAHTNWKSKGHARVQFNSPSSAAKALTLTNSLLFQRTLLNIEESYVDIVPRAVEEKKIENLRVRFGNLVNKNEFEVLGEWEEATAEIVDGRSGDEVIMMVFLEGSDGASYKLEVVFAYVVSTFGCFLGVEEKKALLFQLKYAPKIFHKVRGPSLKTKLRSTRYSYCKEEVDYLWIRVPDFTETSVLGSSYYLLLENSDNLSCPIFIDTLPKYSEMGDLILTQPVRSSSSRLVPIINCPNDCSLPYELLFQLNSLAHMQRILPAHINSDLCKLLNGIPLDESIKILTKMHKLESTCFNPLDFVHSHLSAINVQQCSPTKKENLMSIRRVLVTPSRVYFLGPELESSNYVVKHFSAYASDFMRVTFVDEDRCKLQAQAISTSIEQTTFSKPFRTKIYDRLLSILKDGITIGSKTFEFLAFSASQLRDNSVWMFASNELVNARDIREWMGEFNKIRSVSKCAARMGQLFSSSMPTYNVPARDVEVIPDIEIIKDGVKYNFSDGIGKISKSFADRVAKMCGYSHTPSAFQIRYGGYKGIIAVDPTSYYKLSLRGSMLKFESNNTMLSVTKCSDSQPCYLNREIITLLSTLGVKDETFVSLQDDQMNRLDNMLTNRKDALVTLGKMRGFGVKLAVNMLEKGYEPYSEPYLLMLLKAYREYQIYDLRSRSRVFVPKGRVLVGCLDELGTLNYGQVFLRVTMNEEERESPNLVYFDKADEKTAVVVGKVMVTKNPCLHPGDIRVLDAVYDKDLDDTMGYVDCLVFPQKGNRPHPNECSGGDLDGDLYAIIWDEGLIPPCTISPMEYTARRPRITDHEVTLEEVHKFFVDYMINDNLGSISTAHLVHSDSEPEKANSKKCLELAKLHSMAVDYAKTGAPAEMPNDLRPKKFPDFMERFDKPSYVSTGAIGKMYRACTAYTNGSLVIPNAAAYDCELLVEGYEKFVKAAEEHYEMYAERLGGLMNYYDVEDEDEVLTGYMRRSQIYLRDKRKLEEVKDRMMAAVRSLHREVEEWFTSSCDECDAEKMASAWYHVTYGSGYCGEGRRRGRFLSFPWVMSDVLLGIKAKKKGLDDMNVDL